MELVNHNNTNRTSTITSLHQQQQQQHHHHQHGSNNRHNIPHSATTPTTTLDSYSDNNNNNISSSNTTTRHLHQQTSSTKHEQISNFLDDTTSTNFAKYKGKSMDNFLAPKQKRICRGSSSATFSVLVRTFFWQKNIFLHSLRIFRYAPC